MRKLKKLLGIALVLSIAFNALAIGVSATIGDGDALTAVVHLEVGTMSGSVFTPLPAGTALKTNDVITVRIIPQTDFLCGASRYAVMFSSAYFSIVGSGKAAFTPNTANTFYANVASGWSGATVVPSTAWPASLVSQYSTYKAVCVANTADVTSSNGGFPALIPGDSWLFRFNLKVTQDITAGSGAKIWMDSSWFQTPADTTAAAYFAKVEPGQVYDELIGDYRDRYSTEGSATTYNFKFDIDDSINLEPAAVTNYQITFDAAGGIGGEVQTVASGVTPTPPTVTKTGYTFAGWSPAVVPATADTTYTATWTANNYSITFDAAGGTGGEVQTVAYGVVPTAPVVTRTGYTFAGWDKEIVAVTGDTTYTATWTAINYSITFDAAGGIGGEVQTVAYGVTPTAPVVTKAGYNFTGWDKAIVAATADTTYTATWELIPAVTYQITFDAAGGIGGEVQTVAEGVVPTAPVVTKQGYVFDGWSPAIAAAAADTTYTATWAPANDTPYTINVYQSVIGSPDGYDLYSSTPMTGTTGSTVNATVGTFEGFTFNAADSVTSGTVLADGSLALNLYYRRNVVTVTFITDGGSSIAPAVGEYGAPLAAPAAPTKEGYTFDGWDSVIPATYPASDITLFAQWIINQYSITFDANGGIGGEVQSVPYNTIPTAPVVTRAGYNFTGWDKVIVAATADATYVAQWELIPVVTYQITFDANGGIGGEVQTVNEGVVPTAPVVTRAGYNFTGWDKAIVAAAADATYTAQWELIPTCTITFNTDGGSAVASITGNVGDPITPPENPSKTGYTFAGWNPALPATFPVGSMTVTAQWTPVNYTITFDANGGIGGEVQTVAYGVTPTAPVVTRAGYNFTGWDNAVVAVTGDATYTAQWELIPVVTYQITFDANGGIGGEVQTVNEGVVPTAPVVTRAGYNFTGWDKAIVAAAADTTYVAQWELIPAVTYQITFDAMGGIGGEVQTVAEGTVPTAPVVTFAGHIFLGWTPVVAAATADTTYKAIWLGDVHQDGVINVLDALAALQGSTGEIAMTTAQIAAADVNGDGRISAIDALMILHFATGVLTSFPYPA